MNFSLNSIHTYRGEQRFFFIESLLFLRYEKWIGIPAALKYLYQFLVWFGLYICPTKPKLIYRWLGKMEAEREDVEIHLSNPSKRGPNGQIEYCSVITPNVQPAEFSTICRLMLRF